MIESTALAERAESFPPAAPFYLWEVSQKPPAIHLSLELVGRLEREVVEAFRSVTARGSEIGGILLGRAAGARPAVSVEEYELVECDYSRGPLYRLSDKDRERLKAAIERRAAEGKFQVVGYFRSHTRKGLALDAEDLALFKERFSDPLNVVLLVRPYATKASTGGFFIWEEGQIRGESSYLEFPFNRASLPARDPAKSEKAPARAQVVPIASRREAPAPGAPSAPAAPPPAAVKLDPPAAEAAPPAPPVVEVREEPEPAKECETPARPEAPAEMRVPFGKAEEAVEVPAAGRKLLWICGAAAAVLLVILGLVFVPGLIPWRSKAPAPAAAESSGLALRAERSGGQWLLTWNRESDVVKTATKATLSINDGEQRENVDLDLAQLRNGSIVYSPLTGDVSFRLDVTSSDPSKSQSEYVRALGTRPSAMPSEPAEPAQSAKAKTEPAVSTPEGEDEAEEEEAVPVRAPARPLQLPAGTSLAERLRPARSTDLPEPPPTLAVVGGAQMPGNFGSTVRAPLPPPPPAAQKPAPKAKIGGKVQPARLISRKDPVYPPMARQARVRGVVRVEATVGTDGRVRAVKVVNGHPLLQQAAADAVKQWVYSPMLLNGQPVEFTTHVEVGFNLSGNN